MIRAVLLILGIGFYIIGGLLLLVQPEEMFARIDILFASPMAIEELRASHGGVWLCTGIACVVSIWRRELLRPVLIYLLIFNGGYAVGRLYSFAAGSVAVTQLLPLFLFDVALVAFALFALRQLKVSA